MVYDRDACRRWIVAGSTMETNSGFPSKGPQPTPDGADIPTEALSCTLQLICQKLPLIFMPFCPLKPLTDGALKRVFATPPPNQGIRRSEHLDCMSNHHVSNFINNTMQTKPSLGNRDIEDGVTRSSWQTLSDYLTFFLTNVFKFLPHFLCPKVDQAHNSVWEQPTL